MFSAGFLVYRALNSRLIGSNCEAKWRAPESKVIHLSKGGHVGTLCQVRQENENKILFLKGKTQTFLQTTKRILVCKWSKCPMMNPVIKNVTDWLHSYHSIILFYVIYYICFLYLEFCTTLLYLRFFLFSLLSFSNCLTNQQSKTQKALHLEWCKTENSSKSFLEFIVRQHY